MSRKPDPFAKAFARINKASLAHFNRLSAIKSRQAEYMRGLNKRRTPAQYEAYTFAERQRNKTRGANLSRKKRAAFAQQRRQKSS